MAGPAAQSTAGFELGARESFLLFNNVLLVIAAATVFAGTLAPLISDALKLGTLSVGAPYFNPTFMLSMLPLLVAAGAGNQRRLEARPPQGQGSARCC